MVKRLGFYEENLTISGPVSGLLFFVFFVLALILRLGGGAKKRTKRRGSIFAALLWAIDFCILT